MVEKFEKSVIRYGGSEHSSLRLTRGVVKDASMYQWAYLQGDEIAMLAKGMASLMEKIQSFRPDVLFFMDKSARPIQYMMKKIAYKRSTDGIPRSLFFEPYPYINQKEALPAAAARVISSAYGNLAGQRLLLVDDFIHKGETLQAARSVLGETYPGSKIESIGVFPKPPSWTGDGRYVGILDRQASLSEIAHAKIVKGKPAHVLFNRAHSTEHVKPFHGELDQVVNIIVSHLRRGK